MGTFHGSTEFVAAFARTWAPPRQPHVLANVGTAVRHGTLGEGPVLWNWTSFARALLRAFRVASTVKNRCDCIIPLRPVTQSAKFQRLIFLLRTFARRLAGYCSCKANRAINSREPWLTPRVGREGLLVLGVFETAASRLNHLWRLGLSFDPPECLPPTPRPGTSANQERVERRSRRYIAVTAPRDERNASRRCVKRSAHHAER